MNGFLAWWIVLRSRCVRMAASGPLWAIIAACVISSSAAIIQNHQLYDAAMLEYETAAAELTVPSTTDPEVADSRSTVLRKPSPRATFVRGVEPTTPSGWLFAPDGVEARPPYAAMDQLAALSVLADGESAMRLLGGFFSIALGFWKVSRDRQRGWLAASAWFPLPRWWLMSTLLTAGALIIGLIALLWTGATAALMAWLNHTSTSITPIALFETWLHLWIYFTTMFSLGALVASFGRHALAGLTIVIGVWLVLILVGPQLAATVVRLSTAPMAPDRPEELRRKRYAARQIEADDALARDLSASIPENLPAAELNDFLTETFIRLEPAWRDEHLQALDESAAAAREWLNARALSIARLEVMARFTPGTLLQSAVATVNGQGWAMQHAWQEASARYEDALDRARFAHRHTLTLLIRHNDQVIPWTYVWDTSQSAGALPTFDVPSTTSEASSTGPVTADLLAGLIQLVAVLVITARGVAR